MRKGGRQIKRLISLGSFLVVFPIVWLWVIFPAVAKLPADHHRLLNFQGDYKLMNRETRGLDEIPVRVRREQTALAVQGNVLLINQVITATHARTGEELPLFGLTEMLGVDRSSREYVPGYGDAERSGQFSFPEQVEKRSYSLWIPSAVSPLEARFIGEETFQGIDVCRFKISRQDVDIGIQPETGLPQAVDVIVNMLVEPVSGTTVTSESINVIKIFPVPGMGIPVFISSLTFTDDTVRELVDTARSSRTKLMWARVYGVWMAIGLGAVLVLGGALTAVRRRYHGAA